MENASKALLMAASVLVALIIIGVLVWMFNSISNTQQTEADATKIEIMTEYNNKIERFNKSGLYGSEVLSLANLIEDYNIKQAEFQGYKEINLIVKIKSIPVAEVFTFIEYTNKNLNLTYETLNNKINEMVKKTYANGKSISYFAGLRTNELEQIKLQYPKDDEIQNIETAIDQYNSLKSEMTQFKTKRFGAPIVEYDKYTGRITSMTFTEL